MLWGAISFSRPNGQHSKKFLRNTDLSPIQSNGRMTENDLEEMVGPESR
jgi:hypothetical protein